MSQQIPDTKVTASKITPAFARLAASYLKEGKTLQAMEMCLDGLKVFPNYATGHLILGKSYETLGRTIEAMLEYRRALKCVPDNPTVQAMMNSIERSEQQAFKAFAEERERRLKEQKNSQSIESYLADESNEKESTAEFLLRQLQESRKLSPVAEKTTSAAGEGAAVSPSIVTATLAEIYVNQGEYKEAIEAYKTLMDQRPGETERFAKRIAELEELRRQHQLEPKS
jgi:Tfp pilus assembly protein PilF